jgi:hypothetical protein
MQWKYSIFKILFLLLCCPIFIFSNKLDLSNNVGQTKISVLTCDPGNEIYSLFGHSALRLQNPVQGYDLVVNWGLFEFSENQFDFGYDFAKGRLKYFMGLQSTTNFMEEYKGSRRGIREQILNLNKEEKFKLIKLVENNYKPENRNYKYEFFYDNCSSRIRDLLKTVFNEEIKFHRSSKSNEFTFRETIHEYLKYNPWLELGIDLVLGKKIDVLVNNENLMFLPENIEEILDSTHVKNNKVQKKIVLSKNTLIRSNIKKSDLTSIKIYSWIILSITMLLLIIKKERLFNYWSVINLFVVGILGLVLLFMWFGTDHSGTKMNLNLLWASPLHFVLIFCILKGYLNNFTYWYLTFSIILIFTTILFWFTLTQEFNVFVKPIILQLAIIYYYYFKKCNNQINLNKTKA